MPIIKLPDGKNLNFKKNVTGLEVAEKISKSLSKQALIMSINGELKDLFTIIDKDPNAPPKAKEPVSPINTLAGGALNHKKPRADPIIAPQKTLNSPAPLM